MNSKVLTNSGNINSNVLIADKKVKYIMSQDNYNEINYETNKQKQHQQQQTIK